MRKTISVIGPLYNESALVEKYCSEVINAFETHTDKYRLELILVDDGSKDDTFEKASKIKDTFPEIISLVKLSRNFGLEGAIDAGLRVAIGDAIISMDADLQDPPSVIFEMLEKWELGADIVVGSRVGRPNDTLFKKITANIFYRIMDNLSGKLKLEKSAANFRLLSRRALDQYLSYNEKNRVFRVLVPFLGMKTAVVEYERDKRFAGETKYNFKSMTRYALDSITGISIEPLRKIPSLACISGFISLSLVCVAFFSNSFNLPFVILGILVSFLFTLLFVALSVIAEYLGQICIETKGRPTSIIYSHTPCQKSNEKE